jgi:hypothetical protein
MSHRRKVKRRSFGRTETEILAVFGQATQDGNRYERKRRILTA